MAWVKLDDRFSGNPKVRRAWRQCRASIGLYAMALTYAAQHETDGVIGGWWVDELLPGKEGQKAAKALTDAGLWTWDEAGDAYTIHDYLQHNESRADAQARRERDRERKARGGKRGSIVDSDPGPEGFHAESIGNPMGVHADSGSTRAPVPSRPVHSTPSERENARDRAGEERLHPLLPVVLDELHQVPDFITDDAAVAATLAAHPWATDEQLLDAVRRACAWCLDPADRPRMNGTAAVLRTTLTKDAQTRRSAQVRDIRTGLSRQQERLAPGDDGRDAERARALRQAMAAAGHFNQQPEEGAA